MVLQNAFENLAVESKQDDTLVALAALLTELQSKLESGQAVALDASTLAALESITTTISNWPVDFPDADAAALLTAIKTAVENVLTVTVDDFPSEYPLPSAQVTTLTPQTDGLTDAELRAAPVPVSPGIDPWPTYLDIRTGLTAWARLLTASDSITPSAGKKLMVTWIQVIPATSNSSDNLVTISFDGDPDNLYTVYALGREAVFIGDADQALDIQLETSEKVTVNIHYKEVS